MEIALARIVVNPSTPMVEVMKKMIENDLAAVIVVDDAQNHVGIITGTDILSEIATGAKSPKLLEGTAETAMSKPVAPIAKDASVLDVIPSMLRPILHSLIVQETESERKVVGILTQVGIIKWWIETFVEAK